jgi:hypothetical protein
LRKEKTMAELKKCKCGKEPIRVTKQSGKNVEYAYTCTCNKFMVFGFSKTLDEAKEKWEKNNDGR